MITDAKAAGNTDGDPIYSDAAVARVPGILTADF